VGIEKTYTLCKVNHAGRISFLLAPSHNPALLVRNDMLGKAVMGSEAKHAGWPYAHVSSASA